MAIALDYASEPQRRRGAWYGQLYVQVLVAIAAGVSVGYFWPDAGASLKPLGDAFIKLVKMIIAPVIFLTLVTGIAGMTELKSVGRVAGKAFAYFLFFSTLALVVGLIVANTVQPGAGMNVDPASLDTGAVKDYVAKAHDSSIVGFLMAIIPTTLVSALTGESLLQVLLVSILFGIALSMVGEPAAPVRDLLEKTGLVVFKLVGILMRAAPVGAFGAMAFTIGKYGIESLANLLLCEVRITLSQRKPKNGAQHPKASEVHVCKGTKAVLQQRKIVERDGKAVHVLHDDAAEGCERRRFHGAAV